MKFIYLLLTLSLLSACAGPGRVERVEDLSLNQLKSLNQVKLINDPRDLTYSSKGMIKGISCKKSVFGGNTTEEAAMSQLKIKAINIGANAVLHPTCSQDASVDWGNNCWESSVCIGEAALLE